MNIVFYSTNSNYYDEENLIYTTLPTYESLWQKFITKYSEHDFFVVTQKPGMFLPHTKKTVFLETNDTQEIANKILSLQPDIAISTSFWIAPFDWLPIKDSLIANELEKNGVKVICNSIETTTLCFDKWETHNFFQQQGFNFAQGLLVKHDLYFCAGNQKDVKTNVYKEAVLEKIRSLNFPLVIKDNVGLSSYGMSVANTFGEVTNYLNSKKNNSDRIIEEYLDGEQFGCEIYGVPGNYSILPPLKFSLNQYGITSPKLSTKTGPFYNHFDELKQILLLLAESLQLKGCAQVDLVYHNEQWFIIEINPRLSGMTMTYSGALNLSIYEMIYKTCVLNEQLPEIIGQIENKKIELCSQDQLKQLSTEKDIKYICQTENKAAKQEREKGYCEIIFCRKTETSELN